jgi:3-hydroxyisobutyrate dehydrogenase-like beta-hydroxyacid dehydrogenase
MRIGFIGLGIMGSRMAANLAAKGHQLSVWNRTRARARAFEEKGVGWAATPRALAENMEAVCTCVADPRALAAVSGGPDGFLGAISPGTLVIDFSTVGPAATGALDAECRARGASFLEAPVTGSKSAAEAGTLLLMCGGPADTFARAAPILEAVSAKAIRVGEVGQGAHMKLVGNLIIAHMVEALSEGCALATRAGIPIEKVLEVVQSSGYASPYWDFKGKALAARDFSTHFSVDLMHKDLTLVLAAADALGVPLPGTAAIREVYQMARARGLGQADIIATATVIDSGSRSGAA